MKSKTFNIKALTYGALMVALIAICAWISIPSTVSFTLQTFAIALTLLLLGGKLGTLTIAAYLILGAIGVPVFSNMTGGMASLLGQTGGYLIGFLFMGLAYWLIVKLFGDKMYIKIIALVVGNVLCYAFGTVWFVQVYSNTKGAISYALALSWCVTPFILPDCGKIVLAALLSSRLKKHVTFK